MSKLIEQLADIEHQRWAKWQKWVHEVSTKNDDGSLTIPKDKVERWERQISTPYAELTEEEKESDRKQVREYLPIVEEEINNKIRIFYTILEKLILIYMAEKNTFELKYKNDNKICTYEQAHNVGFRAIEKYINEQLNKQ